MNDDRTPKVKLQESIDSAIEELCKHTKSQEPLGAMQLSQAVLNLAHAKGILTECANAVVKL